ALFLWELKLSQNISSDNRIKKIFTAKLKMNTGLSNNFLRKLLLMLQIKIPENLIYSHITQR
ncbi:MAG TPA: hypothetical protein PK195_11355, partial [Ignavibacteriaceae bacterium]|nr:hypothetical protein [Ignavibacteriaceae bacterium]